MEKKHDMDAQEPLEQGREKRVFEFPEYESVHFEGEDVIVTSGCTCQGEGDSPQP